MNFQNLLPQEAAEADPKRVFKTRVRKIQGQQVHKEVLKTLESKVPSKTLTITIRVLGDYKRSGLQIVTGLTCCP